MMISRNADTRHYRAAGLVFTRQCRAAATPSAAMVGSRHATPQAMRIAKDFGRALSEKGIPVVSGMASGIDTAAHRGALQADGGTIAVWGTGIDRIYPPSNKTLLMKLPKGVDCQRVPFRYASVCRQLSAPQPFDCRIIAADIGGRGGIGIWLIDYRQAGGRDGARSDGGARVDGQSA